MIPFASVGDKERISETANKPNEIKVGLLKVGVEREGGAGGVGGVGVGTGGLRGRTKIRIRNILFLKIKNYFIISAIISHTNLFLSLINSSFFVNCLIV